MTDSNETAENTIESQILADYQLMEFLRGPGKVLFDITSQEAEVLFQASSTIAEFDNKKPITTKISSIEKLRTDIRNKQDYIKELQSKLESIRSLELDELKNIERLKINTGNYSIQDFFNKKKFLSDKAKTIRSKGISLTNMIKEKTDLIKKLQIMLSNNEHELQTIEKELAMRKLPMIVRHDYELKRNNLLKFHNERKIDLEKLQKDLSRIQFKESKIRQEFHAINKELERLDETKKRNRIDRAALWKITTEQRKRKLVKASLTRKLKLAESSLKKLKEQLKKIKQLAVA